MTQDRDHRRPIARSAVSSVALLVAFALASACGKTYARPLLATGADRNSVVVARDYDSVWDDIIEHISSSSFAVKHVERASGLVALDFSAVENVSRYVDCGAIYTRSWSMPYLEWLVKEGYRTALTGWMNIYVRSQSARQTEVRVTARYVVSAIGRSGATWKSWGFDTGQSDLRFGRECGPTYEAERTILDVAIGRTADQ